MPDAQGLKLLRALDESMAAHSRRNSSSNTRAAPPNYLLEREPSTTRFRIRKLGFDPKIFPTS